MRPVNRARRVAVALTMALVWLATLVCEARPVLGAPAVTAADAADVMDPNQMERAAGLDRRRQDLRDGARLLQEQERERLEREHLLEHRSLVHRQTAHRSAAIRHIADLVPPQFHALVLEVAGQFGFDPRVLAAVGSVESQWYTYALGRDGDSGLMQILPETAEWIAGRLGLAEYDLYDPLTNVTMGAWYLNLLYRAHGNWQQALAEYNGGPAAAHRGNDHPYTQLVMRVYRGEGR